MTFKRFACVLSLKGQDRCRGCLAPIQAGHALEMTSREQTSGVKQSPMMTHIVSEVRAISHSSGYWFGRPARTIE